MVEAHEGKPQIWWRVACRSQCYIRLRSNLLRLLSKAWRRRTPSYGGCWKRIFEEENVRAGQDRTCLLPLQEHLDGVGYVFLGPGDNIRRLDERYAREEERQRPEQERQQREQEERERQYDSGFEGAYTDANGNVFLPDGKGGYYPVDGSSHGQGSHSRRHGGANSSNPHSDELAQMTQGMSSLSMGRSSRQYVPDHASRQTSSQPSARQATSRPSREARFEALTPRRLAFCPSLLLGGTLSLEQEALCSGLSEEAGLATHSWGRSAEASMRRT